MNLRKYFFLSNSIALLVFSGIVIFLYSHTFQSPFTFDDSQILDNYYITHNDLSFESLSNISSLTHSKRRMLPNISFAVNYYLGGADVWGYHLGNILVHILTAFFFYLLARTTLTLPSMAGRVRRPAEIALVAALVWAVHPLQTNAVTYIVQRMTSMAALFYIIALFCYVKARIINGITPKILFFAATVLFGVMALFSKENSGMLPIMIGGYELFFLQRPGSRPLNRKIIMGLGGALMLFVLICLLLLGTNPLAGILNGFDHREFTLGQRLLTQTRVIFHYLTLLVLPLPSRLNLAYDYQLSTGLLAPPQTLLAIVGLAGLALLIFFLYRRDRLTSFALFWFLGNLVVESTIIPLELIFEHRMYVPAMFLILSATAWCYRLTDKRTVTPRLIVVGIMALLCVFTWQRNAVWKNEITLWTDVVEKSPGSLRGYGNLGLAYSKSKKYATAEQYLHKAIAIGHNDKSGNFSFQTRLKYLAKAHENLGLVYRELHNYPEALSESTIALELDPSRPDPLVTMGIVYAQINDHQKAYQFFQKASGMGLSSVDLYNNWAVSSFNLGKTDHSIRLLKHALAMDPEHPESHYNLGIAYSSLGMFEEAEREMAMSMELRSRKQR
jgi:tetratricopeptide (TPR) repeat protein